MENNRGDTKQPMGGNETFMAYAAHLAGLKILGMLGYAFYHAGYSLVVGVRIGTLRSHWCLGLVPLAPVTWFGFHGACPSTVLQLRLPEPAYKIRM